MVRTAKGGLLSSLLGLWFFPKGGLLGGRYINRKMSPKMSPNRPPHSGTTAQLRVRWSRRDGSPLPRSAYESGAGDTLYIRGVERGDTGDYACEAVDARSGAVAFTAVTTLIVICNKNRLTLAFLYVFTVFLSTTSLILNSCILTSYEGGERRRMSSHGNSDDKWESRTILYRGKSQNGF